MLLELGLVALLELGPGALPVVGVLEPLREPESKARVGSASASTSTSRFSSFDGSLDCDADVPGGI